MNTEHVPLFKLGAAERLQLVEDLWDSLAQEDSSPPISEATREELLKRASAFEQTPGTGLPWDRVKQQARARHA